MAGRCPSCVAARSHPSEVSGGSVHGVRAAELIEAHRDRWQAATAPAFLAAVHGGSLDAGRFGAWLAQDYLFVSALLSFQARLLARAPRAAQPVLADGVVALVEELTWFEAEAVQWDVPLAAVAEPTTLEYLALLGRLDIAPSQVALVALWALERVYLDAWQAAAPGGGAYREIVEHWTSPAFADYVVELERLVDDALTDTLSQQQETVFTEVLRLEAAFWDAAS
jgi:formylaminopyrimidine deformylase / aminopyrimidine aminohydrolase